MEEINRLTSGITSGEFLFRGIVHFWCNNTIENWTNDNLLRTVINTIINAWENGLLITRASKLIALLMAVEVMIMANMVIQLKTEPEQMIIFFYTVVNRTINSLDNWLLITRAWELIGIMKTVKVLAITIETVSYLFSFHPFFLFILYFLLSTTTTTT